MPPTRNFFYEFIRDVEAALEPLAPTQRAFDLLRTDEGSIFECYESGMTPTEAAEAMAAKENR